MAPPSRSEQNILQNGRAALSLGRKRLKALLDLDRDSQSKAVTKASLDAFEKMLNAFQSAIRAKQGKAGTAKGATSVEVKRRAALSALMKDLRDKVKRRARKDAVLQKAMGVGMKLTATATKTLLDDAESMLGGIDENAAALKKVGVGDKQRKALEAAREALSQADVGQGEAIGARLDASAQKAGLRAQILEQTAIIDQAVKALPSERSSRTRVRGGKARTSAIYAGRGARRARKKKKSGGAKGGAAPAATGTTG